MFRKPFKVAGQSLLGGKDRKIIRRRIATAFPSTLTEAQLDFLLPKDGTVHVRTDITRVSLYGRDGEPMFIVDDNGTGRIIPTVCALVHVPSILPLVVVHSPVSHYLLNGADLMLPGVAAAESGAEAWKKGELRAVMVRGNPCPFAVGEMLVDAPQVAKSGMKGKGMAVIHTFGDQLWMLATAVTAPAGFSPYRVYSLAPSSDSDSDVEGGADGVETTREADQHAAGANSAPQSDSISSSVEGMGNLSVSEDSSKPAEEGEPEPVGESASSSQAVSPEMVDETIMQCFLSALHDTRDDELPILVSSLQSSKVATYVPAGSVADIKQSSFKKLSKFVAHLKKLKLIDVKELGGDFQLMKVHRSHQLFKDFVPLKAHPLNRGKGSADAEEDEEESKLGIQEMFQVPQSVGPALLGDAYRPKALFSKRDLTDALTHYVRENGLVSAANGNMVQLDPILTDIVRKSVKEHVEAVTKKDLFTTHLFAAMKKFTVIQRPDAPDAPIIVSGAVKHVEVAVERRAGRVMTRISHLDKYGIDLDAFAAECQRKFAASATTDVGQSNLREVLIQGDQRKQVPSFVTEALGIPSMYVTVRK